MSKVKYCNFFLEVRENFYLQNIYLQDYYPDCQKKMSNQSRSHYSNVILGAMPIKRGLVLRIAKDGQQGEVHWIWTRNALYYKHHDGSWTQFEGLDSQRKKFEALVNKLAHATTDEKYALALDQERFFRQEAGVEPPPTELLHAYQAIIASWTPSLAPSFNDRAHRFYEMKRYEDAKEVIQYALKLDPQYNLGWYNAAAYAARDGDARQTITFLGNYKPLGKHLLEKIRHDAVFKQLLTMDRSFREYLYLNMVQQEQGSDFLRSFSLDFDISRSLWCDWEVNGCEVEGTTYHEDMLLTRPNVDPDWELILMRDIQDRSQIDGRVSMVDIGNRFFIAFGGKAYEVTLNPPSLSAIGLADELIHGEEGAFPLSLITRISAESTNPQWEVSEYGGEEKGNLKRLGCFKLVDASQPMMDRFWTLEKKGAALQAVDLVSGKIALLISRAKCDP